MSGRFAPLARQLVRARQALPVRGGDQQLPGDVSAFDVCRVRGVEGFLENE